SSIIIGIILGFTGMIIIFSYSLGLKSYTGPVIALSAAASWSIGTVFFKRFIKTESKETVNFYQFVFALPITFIIVVLSGQLGEIVNPSSWAVFLASLIGIPGTAVAYFAFLHLNRDYSVGKISSLLFVVPAISVLFSFILLNQILEYISFVGLVLISIGTFFSSGFVNRGEKNDIQ
ncbi:MAG: DMT family transporter, partial [Thermoplasmataceae archaeon]